MGLHPNPAVSRAGRLGRGRSVDPPPSQPREPQARILNGDCRTRSIYPLISLLALQRAPALLTRDEPERGKGEEENNFRRWRATTNGGAGQSELFFLFSSHDSVRHFTFSFDVSAPGCKFEEFGKTCSFLGYPRLQKPSSFHRVAVKERVTV